MVGSNDLEQENVWCSVWVVWVISGVRRRFEFKVHPISEGSQSEETSSSNLLLIHICQRAGFQHRLYIFRTVPTVLLLYL